MGQATRTTKLLDLGRRDQGGANLQKRAALDATAEVLTAARAFYIDFFLAHAGKFSEQVSYYSEEHLELRERLISAHELLSWAEACTVETAALSRDALYLPPLGDQRRDWQSALLSLQSRELGKEREAEGKAGTACGHRSPHALPGMHPNSARGPRSQSGLRAHQLLHRRGMALDALPGHLQPLQRRATPGNRLAAAKPDARLAGPLGRAA